ncbi:MAG: DUF3307 domain-containing protein [Chloroflexota bacterium]|nr:DUF3307 domain-containing protein [Chloroflexota bacterium]
MLFQIPVDALHVPVSTFLIWFACHFVGDFAFQSTWMSVEKGRSWEVNFYHCATYTAVFVLFVHPSILAITILIITHFIIDTLKARYKVIGPIWLDQLLHLLTIVLILLSGV